MIGALSIMAKQPCLISRLSDDCGPDLIIIEPLKVVFILDGVQDQIFVHANQDALNKKVVHS